MAPALFFYFFALTSSDRKHHTCSDNYITPLGSDSSIKNYQTAFREEYLNYLIDGVQRRPFCSWAYEMFLQERSSRTQTISGMRDSFGLKDILL